MLTQMISGAGAKEYEVIARNGQHQFTHILVFADSLDQAVELATDAGYDVTGAQTFTWEDA